jgi:hypothetical protein
MARRIASRLWEQEEDKKFVSGLRQLTKALTAAGMDELTMRDLTIHQLWDVWENLADIKASARRI